ncbi:hypothetical protein COCCADRAFT_98934, partial [Bipolaris zeicola 26-R-13]
HSWDYTWMLLNGREDNVSWPILRDDKVGAKMTTKTCTCTLSILVENASVGLLGLSYCFLLPIVLVFSLYADMFL